MLALGKPSKAARRLRRWLPPALVALVIAYLALIDFRWSAALPFVGLAATLVALDRLEDPRPGTPDSTRRTVSHAADENDRRSEDPSLGQV